MTELQFIPPVDDEPVESTRRRGRPRSQETLARDEAVVQALRVGTLTREQLAEQLGDRSSLVYLALWRLVRQGRVEKVADDVARHGWRLVG